MAEFDVDGARRAGYSDAEIAGYLAGQDKFDLGAAKSAGYSDAEVIQHLGDRRAQHQAARSGDLGRRFMLGVRDVAEGVAALPGMAYDAASLPVNAAVDVANWATGARLPRVRPAAEHIAAAADAVGLPQAETSGERFTSAVNRNVAGLLPTLGAGVMLRGAAQTPELVEALAGYVPPSVAGATARTAAAQAARGEAPRLAAAAARAPELAEVLAGASLSQAAGAVAGGLVQEGMAQDGWDPLAQAAAGLVGGVAGAATVPVGAAAWRGGRALLMPFGEEGRRQIVADVLLRSSGRPQDLAGRVAAGADPVVPGSMPTTAEAGRDAGLAQLQRAVQGMDPGSADAFALRDASRDAARRAEARAIEPAEGGAATLADAVRGAVAREEQRHERVGAAADARLRERLGQLPGRVTPEQAGAAIRGELRDAHDGARAATNSAYDAIDPENTSRLPLEPVRHAAREAEARYFGDMAGPMPRELRSALDDLHDEAAVAAREVAPWRSLQNLQARLGTLADDPDPRVQAVVGQIREAIDTTAERAALPYERQSWPVGLSDLDRAAAAEGAGQHPDIAQRLEVGRQDLAATAGAEPPPEGLSLVQFLRQAGGIQNQGGEVAAIMGGSGRAMPALWSSRGLTLERATEAAFERGYLRGNTWRDNGPMGASPRDLLDAIDAELRGLEKRYPGQDVRSLRGGARAETLADDLDREIAARGGTYHADSPEETLRSLRARPEDAPAAGPETPDRFAPIPDAFTPEQAAAWREATELRRQQGERFDRPPVRDLLRQQVGAPVVPDSGVAGRFFRAGEGSPEAARQFLAAVGDRPAAVQALEAHVATSLRNSAARQDGTLDPARWRRWMDRHAPALAQFPEIRDRLRSVGEATATVERVAGLHKASVREIERGVAGYFLQQDPEKAVRGALAAGNAAKAMGDLRRLVGEDPQAMQALRRAYLDAWMKRADTTTLDAGGGFRLSPAAAQQFFRDTQAAARVIFSPGDLARIEALAADFANGAFPSSVGRAAGSNTYQNLSTGNFIARATNGVIDPGNAVAQALGSGFGLLQKLAYAQPEALMRDLLREAMLDPRLAQTLLAKASPESVRRAMGYVERNQLGRMQAAANTAVARQLVRSTGAEGNRRQRQ